MVQGMLQPLDGLIVFLFLLPVADSEGEIRTGEDIIEVAVDGSLALATVIELEPLWKPFAYFQH